MERSYPPSGTFTVKTPEEEALKIEEDKANDFHSYLADLYNSNAVTDPRCVQKIVETVENNEYLILKYGHCSKMLDKCLTDNKPAQLTFFKNFIENTSHGQVMEVIQMKGASFAIEHFLGSLDDNMGEEELAYVGKLFNYVALELDTVIFDQPSSHVLRKLVVKIGQIIAANRESSNKKSKTKKEARVEFKKLKDQYQEVVEDILFGKFNFGLKNFDEHSRLIQDVLKSNVEHNYDIVKRYFDKVWSSCSEGAFVKALKSIVASHVFDCFIELLKDGDLKIMVPIMESNVVELSDHGEANHLVSKFIQIHPKICRGIGTALLPNLTSILEKKHMKLFNAINIYVENSDKFKKAIRNWFSEVYGDPDKVGSFANFLTNSKDCKVEKDKMVTFDPKKINSTNTALMKMFLTAMKCEASQFYARIDPDTFSGMLDFGESARVVEAYLDVFEDKDTSLQWVVEKLGGNIEKLFLGKAGSFVFTKIWKFDLSLPTRNEAIKLIRSTKDSSTKRGKYGRLEKEVNLPLYLENKSKWDKSFSKANN
uniref:PUM-HD domain-containing protein n=1 Tax=Rhabditophanes sp. KR3021 TaxID=114890 RepID=A0AC35U116_9BILA